MTAPRLGLVTHGPERGSGQGTHRYLHACTIYEVEVPPVKGRRVHYGSTLLVVRREQVTADWERRYVTPSGINRVRHSADRSCSLARVIGQ